MDRNSGNKMISKQLPTLELSIRNAINCECKKELRSTYRNGFHSHNNDTRNKKSSVNKKRRCYRCREPGHLAGSGWKNRNLYYNYCEITGHNFNSCRVRRRENYPIYYQQQYFPINYRAKLKYGSAYLRSVEPTSSR